MRVNKYIAAATGLSRRAADAAIEQGRVQVNGTHPPTGRDIGENDRVTLDGKQLTVNAQPQTIMLNKPIGYVVSRDGQGSATIYDLLPPTLHHLKPVGRLDKNSSGLLLMTTDGQLAQELTHPKYQKSKVYEVQLNKPLTPHDWERITKTGVPLEDGPSRFRLDPVNKQNFSWVVTMQEGRNRQIRRTFEALGYRVVKLHRTQFGPYKLDLKSGSYTSL